MAEKKVFIISDTHFAHTRIIQYENRPFNSVKEMDKEIIKRWNEKVTNNDIVFHLGDFCFGNKEMVSALVSELNGKKILVMGNHDRGHNIKYYLDCGFDEVYNYPILYKEFFIFSHEPITYLKAPFTNLYGHCIDEQTEILTRDGWKKHNEIKETDIVLNLNLQKNIIEENKINKIIHNNFTGNVYTFKTSQIDMRVTDKHRMLYVDYKKRYKIITADKLHHIKTKRFVLAGQSNNKGVNLSDDMLRLLVWITADGHKDNTSLIRFRLHKERKIKELENLLLKLNISFRKYEQKIGYTINFTLPKELVNYTLKPLDNKLLNVNKHQCDIIIETYSKTDGHKYSDNCINIYTSKKEEADLIQKICILNNKSCTINVRKNQGFKLASNKEKISYELHITNRNTIMTFNNVSNVESVNNEYFWCVNTDNGTIIIRRNGKVCIIGNCHSSPNYPTFTRNSVCCCVERWNYAPINFNTILLNLERLQRQMETALNTYKPIETLEDK